MRVLVTRPQPSATRTATRLEALGHQPILLPMTVARHDPQAAFEVLAGVHAAIAVTSAEALRAIASESDALKPHLDTPLFCVGAATAAAARDTGFTDTIIGGGTGADLAATILLADARSKVEPLLYLSGTPRAPDFENALRDAAITFKAVNVYTMEPIVREAGEIARLFSEAKPDAILFYSVETARHFFASDDVKSLDLLGIRMLCMSSRIAEAVPDSLSKAVATRPDEQSLLDLL